MNTTVALAPQATANRVERLAWWWALFDACLASSALDPTSRDGTDRGDCEELCLALLLVGGVDAHQLARGVVALVGHLVRTPALFLLRVDPAGRHLGREAVLRHVEVLQHPLDQPLLVVGVEDLEVLRQLRLAPVQAQQLALQRLAFFQSQ